MAAIIAEGAVLQTKKFTYKHIEECVGEELEVLTDKGFQYVKVEPIDYQGSCVQFILWGYPDWLYVATDDIIKGTTYEKCLDLGGLGICRPHMRCWDECPDNHPIKIHFKNPIEGSFFDIRKRGHVCLPTTCTLTYSHRDSKFCQEYYHKKYTEGFEFSRNYAENREEMPLIDHLYYLDTDPTEFKAFMLGWYEGMRQTKLDLWNYFLILKNKQLAYQVQFLFNYFGVACALEPYHSQKFGYDNWAVVWCKNKKAFHYKQFLWEKEFRLQIKKWTPFTTDDELIKPMKWFNVTRGKNNDAKYFAAPFYFKY